MALWFILLLKLFLPTEPVSFVFTFSIFQYSKLSYFLLYIIHELNVICIWIRICGLGVNFECVHSLSYCFHWHICVFYSKLTCITYFMSWLTYRDSNPNTRPKELVVYIDLPLLVSCIHTMLNAPFIYLSPCIHLIFSLFSCSIGICCPGGVRYSEEEAHVGLQEASVQLRHILVIFSYWFKWFDIFPNIWAFCYMRDNYIV